jgi:hypothetical protein
VARKTGWFIEVGEDGKRRIVEYSTDKDGWEVRVHGSGVAYGTNELLEIARDPAIDNGCQVFWTEEAARDELMKQTDPVEYWFRQMEAGAIDRQDFEQLVGRIPARARMDAAARG